MCYDLMQSVPADRCDSDADGDSVEPVVEVVAGIERGLLLGVHAPAHDCISCNSSAVLN